MKTILTLIFLSLSLTTSGAESRYAFSGFIIDNNNISAAPLILLFSNGAKKNAQLFGVGWYEYSLITDKTVEFVAEEHNKIFDRRKSTAPAADICDLYGAIFNGKGIEIDAPDFSKTLSNDKLKMKYDDELEFQKQDYTKLLNNLKTSKFYKIDILEPGFIQLERSKAKQILFAKKDNVVIYIRILIEASSIEFVLLDKTKEVDGFFNDNDG